MIYTCKYRTAGPDGDRGNFISEVRAGDVHDLKAVLKQRRLGEVWDGCIKSWTEDSLSIIMEREGCTVRTVHHACFLGFVALKSEAVPVDWVLGDKGLLHEMLHHLDLPEEPETRPLYELVEMARKIEQAIPGSSLTCCQLLEH